VTPPQDNIEEMIIEEEIVQVSEGGYDIAAAEKIVEQYEVRKK
jgi:hypothetical protein